MNKEFNINDYLKDPILETDREYKIDESGDRKVDSEGFAV